MVAAARTRPSRGGVSLAAHLSKMIANRKIEQHLDQSHPEILEGFKVIISAASLLGPASLNMSGRSLPAVVGCEVVMLGQLSLR